MRAWPSFKGMPLRVLWIYNTGITDLTPLQGMPLENDPPDPEEHHPGPGYSPRHEEPQDHRHPIEQAWPAAEFWERYDKGEFKE